MRLDGGRRPDPGAVYFYRENGLFYANHGDQRFAVNCPSADEAISIIRGRVGGDVEIWTLDDA